MVTILVDSREKKPKNVIKTFPAKLEVTQLAVGDYACSKGCCAWERKEMDIFDFKKTLTQISELRKAYKNHYMIISLNPDQYYNSKRGNKMAKIGLVASLLAQNITPLFEPDYYRMLTIIYRTILKNHDGKDRNYDDHIHQRHVSNKDVKLNVLTSLPGVGLDKAKIIRENYPSLSDFFIAPKKEIEALPTFGPKTAEKIFKCLNSP